MIKQEAKHDNQIAAWIRFFLKTHNAVKVEAKHSRGTNIIAFRAVEDHQIADLEGFHNNAPFVHKFDDVGYRIKPCDFIGVAGGYSFIACIFEKFIAIISINEWMREEKKCGRKSITSERAKEIAFDIIKR